MRSNKYNAETTIYDGFVFDSKAEARRYAELKILEKAGLIKDLVRQPRYTLQDSFKCRGKTYRPITYIGDFRYTERATGAVVVEDVKGYKTDVFKIKEKLFRHRYLDIELRIIN